MKTLEEIKTALAFASPSIRVRLRWQQERDAPPDFWVAVVTADAMGYGELVSGEDYLGGVDVKSPDVNGYLPQMVEDALRELAGKTGEWRVREQVKRALSALSGEPLAEIPPPPARLILTTYRPATGTRGSSIVAKCGRRSLAVPYPHELSGEECHVHAARALMQRHEWAACHLRPVEPGSVPPGACYAFVLE